LRDQGVTHEVMLSLNEKCKRYGGVSGLLEGMNHYMTIQDLKNESTSIDANLTAKRGELAEVSTRLENEEGVVEALDLIYSYGWTPLSLMAFPQWLRASDTPESIREALKGTRSIQDLQARIKDLSKRHSALDIENVHLTRENIRALNKLEALTQAMDVDVGQDFNKWREELNRRLHLKLSGDDALTFISLLTDYVEIDPKSYEVNKVLLKVISNFLLALEACKEASAYLNLTAILRQAKAEFESNVRAWEIAEKLTRDRSK